MRSWPEVTVHYKPAIVRPGDELTVDLDMVSHESTPVSRITITLSGQEKVLGEGENPRTRSHVSLVASFPATTLETGTHTRSAVFKIPKGAPPTVRAAVGPPLNEIAVEYELVVDVEIPWWPDLRKAFVLVVDPQLSPAIEIPSKRFAGKLAREGERALPFEVWLDRTMLRRGEALSGHLLFARFPENEKAYIHVSFVATAQGLDFKRDFARYESPLLPRIPTSGSPVDFAAVLPADAPPSFKGIFTAISWRADITVEGSWLGNAAVTSIPVKVFDAEGGTGAARGLPSDIVHLGKERRFHLWTQVAAARGLVLDEEAERLRWTAGGEVEMEVFVEDGPTGRLTVAQLAWPALGVELRVGPRRLTDVLRRGVVTEDDVFDRLYRVEAREGAQALAVLCKEVRVVLARFRKGNVTISDEGARMAVGGDGRDEGALVQLVRRAKALAEGLAKGFVEVPMPAVLARGEPAWRGVASRLGGRFLPGCPWIRDGKWNEATVEIGIVWEGGVVHGTVLRMALDPPLGSAVDPRAPEGRLSRATLARMNSLAEKVSKVVFGPKAVEVTFGGAMLDPAEALPLFEEMAAVAAALQGRLEGPYR